MELDSPVTAIPGIGGAYAQKLDRLGIATVEDLLNHLPVRYLDYGHPTTIADLQQEQEQCFRVQLRSKTLVRSRRGQKLLAAQFGDQTGKLAVLWFNQDYLLAQLEVGAEYYLAGIPSKDRNGRVQLLAPIIEPVERGGVFTTGLVPVYPLTEGVSSRYLQAKIGLVINQETLPSEFLSTSQLKETALIPNASAYHRVHQPKTEAEYHQGRRRLAFNQLLAQRLKSELARASWAKKKTTPLPLTNELLAKFENSLPFSLTGDQKQVITQIRTDLERKHPMNRLLQGDVGSGKTVVAAAGLLACVEAGHQAVFMAPTQVLAVQHHQTLTQILTPFGIKPELVVGGRKAKSAPLLIGTHALLHRKELLAKHLGLLVIDEQHRFGVGQRQQLLEGKQVPHLLTMTATPIPRTIAMSVFGHLELSYLKEKPAGRQKIKTWVVPEKKRTGAFAWVKKELTSTKAQAFVVCPFVDESETESLKNVKAATSELENLTRLFSPLRVELLHGRLKPAVKEEILSRFGQGEFDILLTTPVVEVGVDIPNASIMIIEDAWKFGLAALHQLRGRVGRNDRPAYCLLFPGSGDSQISSRLRLLEKTEDGLKLAEADFKIRGPGQLFGTAQSGYLDTNLATYWDASLKSASKKLASSLMKTPKRAEAILTKINLSLAKSEVRN